MSQKFVVVDLETTGNSRKQGDRIIQISAVIIDNLQIVDQYTTYINPEIPIPPFIEELTGINDNTVQDAPLFVEIAEKITTLLENAVFVAHNVAFDLSFLQQELAEVGYRPLYTETIDTVELSKILMPSSPSYKLSDLSNRFDFIHDHPHQADSDALATAELFLLLIEKAKHLPIVTLEKLADMAYYLKSDISSLFHAIIKEQQQNLQNLPENLEVFRGIALKKKKFFHQDVEIQSIEYPVSEEKKQLLFKDSSFKFQLRDSQMAMMDDVYHAFSEKIHTVIEAGTGTGKSIAYLLPAIYKAKETNNPIVVSTYTNQMQEQLLNNEITKLSKILPFPIRATVLKGRNHYINLFKFEQALKEEDHQYDTLLTKMQILVWLTFTDTGDLNELNFSGGGNIFKQRIKHDGWFAGKERDPWITKDFYLYARETAKVSDIVIVNHTLLLLDHEINEELKYNNIIIDEAHHFYKIARKTYGRRIEYSSVKFWIGKLGTIDKGQLFHKLETNVKRNKIKTKLSAIELEENILQLEEEIDILFSQLSKFLLLFKQKNSTHKESLRLNQELKNRRDWNALLMCAERAHDFHRTVQAGLEDRLSSLKKKDKLSDEERAFLEEMNSFMIEWIGIGDKLKTLLLKQKEEDIVWIEGDLRVLPNTLSVREEPRDIDSILSEKFFKKYTCVFTSATLTVHQSFQYFLNEIGLNNTEHVEKIYPSPFKFRDMAKLMIPTDLPEIRGKDTDDYAEAIAGHIIAIAESTNGRMLILFTSYELLSKTYHLVKESGTLEDFVLLAQGITVGSNTRLVKSLQQFNKAILFGTNSFWEGVDIPGKDLSCLVIVRLPFSPPNEPVTEAIYEKLKREGIDPFTAFALPEAVLRFKQGFGRLIRSESDRGVVIVFDRRLDTTTYGKVFLKSLPDVSIKRGNLNEIIDDIEKWL